MNLTCLPTDIVESEVVTVSVSGLDICITGRTCATWKPKSKFVKVLQRRGRKAVSTQRFPGKFWGVRNWPCYVSRPETSKNWGFRARNQTFGRDKKANNLSITQSSITTRPCSCASRNEAHLPHHGLWAPVPHHASLHQCVLLEPHLAAYESYE